MRSVSNLHAFVYLDVVCAICLESTLFTALLVTEVSNSIYCDMSSGYVWTNRARLADAVDVLQVASGLEPAGLEVRGE